MYISQATQRFVKNWVGKLSKPSQPWNSTKMNPNQNNKDFRPNNITTNGMSKLPTFIPTEAYLIRDVIIFEFYSTAKCRGVVPILRE